VIVVKHEILPIKTSEDVALALTDGYTTGKGLGLGLSGAKRLSSEFAIESKPGAGTKVTFARWR
jgi:serine/threonine-protein kinase RsbT